MEQIQNGFLQLSESAEKEITETMPPEEEMNDLADFFRIFGDATRLKILYALKFSEMCVLDIAQLFRHVPVGNFPPAPCLKADGPGEKQKGRQDHFLFPCGCTHRDYFKPGS